MVRWSTLQLPRKSWCGLVLWRKRLLVQETSCGRSSYCTLFSQKLHQIFNWKCVDIFYVLMVSLSQNSPLVSFELADWTTTKKLHNKFQLLVVQDVCKFTTGSFIWVHNEKYEGNDISWNDFCLPFVPYSYKIS